MTPPSACGIDVEYGVPAAVAQLDGENHEFPAASMPTGIATFGTGGPSDGEPGRVNGFCASAARATVTASASAQTPIPRCIPQSKTRPHEEPSDRKIMPHRVGARLARRSSMTRLHLLLGLVLAASCGKK